MEVELCTRWHKEGLCEVFLCWYFHAGMWRAYVTFYFGGAVLRLMSPFSDNVTIFIALHAYLKSWFRIVLMHDSLCLSVSRILNCRGILTSCRCCHFLSKCWTYFTSTKNEWGNCNTDFSKATFYILGRSFLCVSLWQLLRAYASLISRDHFFIFIYWLFSLCIL
jgi:hypothetical protein